MMSKSVYLQKLLDEIGGSIHSLNTIAISLSYLSPASVVPSGLNITWNPVNVSGAAKNSRRFAIRSSVVFHAEMLFEYLSEISKDPFWRRSGLNFNVPLKSQDSKARRVSALCKEIPNLEREWMILAELMCHWRNKIVHAKSNAQISSKDRQFLQGKAQEIHDNYYHFDVNKAIEDFRADKVTLKEVTTLTTFLLKCCTAIDAYYLSLVQGTSQTDVIGILSQEKVFVSLTKQSTSAKKERQLKMWLNMHYGILSQEMIDSLVKHYI